MRGLMFGVQAGSALLFYQTVVHEGEPVGAGCHKFIIRTDLMFQRDTPCCDSESDVTAFRRTYRYACFQLSPFSCDVLGAQC